jgi:hypothetical protein
MTYDLQAEGINGVVSQTTVTANAGFTVPVWTVDATAAPAPSAILGSCNGGNGVYGRSASVNDCGVWGQNTNHGFGVSGSTDAGSGARGPIAGVWGSNAGAGPGVRGTNSSGSGDGVFGEGRNGVHGQSDSPTDSGVWGDNKGADPGVRGTNLGTLAANGDGVLGEGINGVHGRSRSATDSGVWGENIEGGFGVSGSTNGGTGTKGTVAGVWGSNSGLEGAGVRGTSTAGYIGVLGEGGTGVWGQGELGVRGTSAGRPGFAPTAGVWGESTGGGFGVWGTSSGGGYGGVFGGDLAPLRLIPAHTAGHPKTGEHLAGEFYVDSTGVLFYCLSPGNWKTVHLV